MKTLRISVGELTLEEVNNTEVELLEMIEVLPQTTEKIRNRLCNLVKNRFRLERAIMWIDQQIRKERKKK